jgi:hypothetical protein
MSPFSDELSCHGWRPADPPRQPVLFVNPRSGGGAVARARIAERARERGIEVAILTPGQRLTGLVRAAVASGADALGMAGGDGSAEHVSRYGTFSQCCRSCDDHKSRRSSDCGTNGTTDFDGSKS